MEKKLSTQDYVSHWSPSGFLNVQVSGLIIAAAMSNTIATSVAPESVDNMSVACTLSLSHLCVHRSRVRLTRQLLRCCRRTQVKSQRARLQTK